jgi:phage gp36-like protein
MSYATLQNLLDRGLGPELVELGYATDGTDASVTDALQDADAEINSYITAANTPTPLNPVPRVIVLRAIDIARYKLWRDRASEKVAADYAAATAWLKLLATGQINLGDNAVATVEEQSNTPQSSANERMFTKDTLSSF